MGANNKDGSRPNGLAVATEVPVLQRQRVARDTAGSKSIGNTNGASENAVTSTPEVVSKPKQTLVDPELRAPATESGYKPHGLEFLDEIYQHCLKKYKKITAENLCKSSAELHIGFVKTYYALNPPQYVIDVEATKKKQEKADELQKSTTRNTRTTPSTDVRADGKEAVLPGLPQVDKGSS